MSIPVQRFLRILVIGEDSGQVARLIEDELHFTVRIRFYTYVVRE